MGQDIQLLPEWCEQEAVILAWPDEDTDWRPWLDSVRDTYLHIIKAITDNNTGVILLVRPNIIEALSLQLQHFGNLLLLSANYDDTWCRDYCFLTCANGEQRYPVEFRFNGWGNKFDASKDNQINKTVLAQLCKNALTSHETVVEGGALEIDYEGNLLSTKLCLENPQRNGSLSIAEYARLFTASLGASRVDVFEHGHLQGDDTDGHIDTLVRFTPNDGLVIQSCFNDKSDPHYSGLQSLVGECKAAFPQHQIYELPLPKVFNQNGERLPASYANFLISNNQVLCPTYRVLEDKLALEIISQAFVEMKIVPIDSYPLIQQFGSIHCISMQVPKSTLKEDILGYFGKRAMCLNETSS